VTDILKLTISISSFFMSNCQTITPSTNNLD